MSSSSQFRPLMRPMPSQARLREMPSRTRRRRIRQRLVKMAVAIVIAVAASLVTVRTVADPGGVQSAHRGEASPAYSAVSTS